MELFGHEVLLTRQQAVGGQWRRANDFIESGFHRFAAVFIVHVKESVIGLGRVSHCAEGQGESRGLDRAGPSGDQAVSLADLADWPPEDIESPEFGACIFQKTSRGLVNIGWKVRTRENFHHFLDDPIVNLPAGSAEWRRPSRSISGYLDYLFLVMDVNNAPASPGKDDCHPRCEDHDDRKHSERLAVGDDSVFFGRLKYCIEAVMLDQSFTLATKEKAAVGRLLDQFHIRTTEFPEKMCKHPRADATERSPFTKRRVESFRADAAVLGDYGKDLVGERR